MIGSFLFLQVHLKLQKDDQPLEKCCHCHWCFLQIHQEGWGVWHTEQGWTKGTSGERVSSSSEGEDHVPGLKAARVLYILCHQRVAKKCTVPMAFELTLWAVLFEDIQKSVEAVFTFRKVNVFFLTFLYTPTMQTFRLFHAPRFFLLK